MGQNVSAERPPQAGSNASNTNTTQQYETLGDGQRPENQEQEGLLRTTERSGRRWNGFSGSSGLSRITSLRPRPQESHSTYRRETRVRSTLITEHPGAEDGDAHGRDDVVLEQEERPLILRNMNVRQSEAPITDIQAAPMPRRASVLSRLSSRVVPRNSQWAAQRGTARESEERLTENSGTADAVVTSASPRVTGTHANRFSMFDLPTPGLLTEGSAPRRNSLSNTTFPADTEIPSGLEVHEPEAMARPPRPSTSPNESETTWSRGPRGRLRRRLFEPLENLLSGGRRSAATNRERTARPRPRPRPGPADELRNLISPQGTGATAAEHTQPAEQGTEANPVELDSPDRPTSWLPGSRTSDHHSDSRRGSRRIQQLLGGRTSRLVRRDDDTPLSRLLQLAAAAIANQLSGSNDASPDLQSVGDDHFDGNLNAFIQSLNTAAEQSANDESNSSNSNLTPLNFWRVFRFVNNRDSGSGLNQHPPSSEEGSTGRLVTLVVVGVRSVPSSSVLGDAAGPLNTNLDGLLALPTSPEGLNFDAGTPPFPTNTRSRFGRRRASLTGASPFPSQYESQRHQGTSSNRLNRTTGLNPLRRSSTATSAPGSQARPPSPFPNATSLDAQGDSADHAPTSFNTSQPLTGEQASTRRQRRRDDGHGNLGSGAARRNGVVEPDRDSTRTEPSSSSNGRHWLIYVVGTNLAEDHPAFQAPSLFTENPSYEDMVMLSTLLGPVKPPVATAEEIAAARGVFRLEVRRGDGTWTARAIDREASAGHGIASPLEAMSADVVKCLVCQDDFESGDEVRQLVTCKHVYHRQCVDEWLTTGRNSCPMCRTPGVEELAQPQTTPAQ